MSVSDREILEEAAGWVIAGAQPHFCASFQRNRSEQDAVTGRWVEGIQTCNVTAAVAPFLPADRSTAVASPAIRE